MEQGRFKLKKLFLYLNELTVLYRVYATLGHPQPLGLVQVVGQGGQVDGREVRTLEKGVQAVLGAKGPFLL